MLGGSSDLGFAFGADSEASSVSSSISDHCVLFFGTVSLGTPVALGGVCAPGGDNAFGAEVVLGKGAFFAIGVFGDAAFGAAALGDDTIGEATTGTTPFGAVAFGVIALGDGTDLGGDAAFGEDGALASIQPLGPTLDLQ